MMQGKDAAQKRKLPMGLILISYDIVTPESAENGDTAENGWDDENGTEYTAEEAIAFLAYTICSDSDYQSPPVRSAWYTESEGTTDYRTGAVKTRSFHLSGFTDDETRQIFDAVNDF